MNRRDLIIVAVLLNAAILSFLFFTATRPEDENVYQPPLDQAVVLDAITIPPSQDDPYEISLTEQPAPRDEVDKALEPYLAEQTPAVIQLPEQHLDALPVKAEASLESPVSATQEDYAEVTVKRGDALEKIAKNNGTTVKEIKRINNLTNDRISVGQVLLVPPNGKKAAETTTTSKTSSATTSSKKGDTAAQYYTIKSGDNPWKIAKQNNIKLDDLLKLNNMTEEKARNLKIGEKIRVK